MFRFENQCFKIEYDGDHADVQGLSGWKCEVCDEVIFDLESAARYGAAGDELVLKNRR